MEKGDKEGVGMNLTACIMTYNHERWIKTCIASIIDVVDRIVVVDGGSKDDTLEIISSFQDTKIEVYYHKYFGNIGVQRNNMLRHLRPGEWVLVIDSDEVLCDNGFALKDFIKTAKNDVFNVHMEHFVWHFGLVDASRPKHFVPRRLFKFNRKMFYPKTKHTVLFSSDCKPQDTEVVTIFHCGCVNGVKDLIKKHRENVKNSEIHTDEFLVKWKNAHLMGTYPTRKYTGEIPTPLREEFEI